MGKIKLLFTKIKLWWKFRENVAKSLINITQNMFAFQQSYAKDQITKNKVLEKIVDDFEARISKLEGKN